MQQGLGKLLTEALLGALASPHPRLHRVTRYPQHLVLTPMAKRSTPCIFVESMTAVRLRGSPNMSPSVSTTMTLDAFSLEPWLGVKMLSLNRGE